MYKDVHGFLNNTMYVKYVSVLCAGVYPNVDPYRYYKERYTTGILQICRMCESIKKHSFSAIWWCQLQNEALPAMNGEMFSFSETGIRQ